MANLTSFFLNFIHRITIDVNAIYWNPWILKNRVKSYNIFFLNILFWNSEIIYKTNLEKIRKQELNLLKISIDSSTPSVG